MALTKLLPQGLVGTSLPLAYAARIRKSTFTASNGNSMRPSSARVSTPACKSAVTSPCTAFTSRPTRRAASPMDTGPAPRRTFRSSQRFAVSTSQSNSGVAKPMRASRSARPVFMARAASANVSLRERTSRTTMFMVPPRDVSFKVSHQLIGRRKGVRLLSCLGVPVIALCAFIVVAQYAPLLNHIRQPVFEPVRRGRKRRRNMPDRHFDECVGSHHRPATDQGCSLHVGDNTNTGIVLSIDPTYPDLP